MSKKDNEMDRYAHLGAIKANDLLSNQEYAIDGKIYIFDGFSTFWNLRMIDKTTGQLHIFMRNETIVTKP